MAFIIIFLGIFIFTFFNEKCYQMPIGKIIDVQRLSTQHVSDDQHNKDIKYKDRLTVRILNGKFEGKSTTITNEFVKSQVDSERFTKTIKFYYIFLKIRATPISLRKARWISRSYHRHFLHHDINCRQTSRFTIDTFTHLELNRSFRCDLYSLSNAKYEFIHIDGYSNDCFNNIDSITSYRLANANTDYHCFYTCRYVSLYRYR